MREKVAIKCEVIFYFDVTPGEYQTEIPGEEDYVTLNSVEEIANDLIRQAIEEDELEILWENAVLVECKSAKQVTG